MDIEQRVLETDETDINAEQVEAGLQGLVSWLFSKSVLQTAEIGAGVVDWLTSDGRWHGLYPEICGYYLQYLVQAAPATGTGRDTSFRLAAADVAAWLDAVGGSAAEPPTLYQPEVAEPDWRNQCLFAFDLAIILRGLTAARHAGPDRYQPAPRSVTRHHCFELSTMGGWLPTCSDQAPHPLTFR
jgi:hypothetical protein